MKATVAIAIALLSTSCTYVKTDPTAENIVLANKSRVQNCKRIGTANTRVKADIVGINRKPQKVASELLALARNEAANIGGNTLVADSEIAAGKQRFIVYQCP
jgi:hypothetical protein